MSAGKAGAVFNQSCPVSLKEVRGLADLGIEAENERTVQSWRSGKAMVWRWRGGQSRVYYTRYNKY